MKKIFTIILACMADGNQFAYLKENYTSRKLSANTFICANLKGWVNETEMLWWIENTWTRRTSFDNQKFPFNS